MAIKATIRDELQEGYNVFYITSWGYAADHLIGWLPKAINCHYDMFALLAHEGSRPKYLAERTRGERPPLIPFTEFLNDMGMTFSAIGDCYSYRAGQMPELLKVKRYKNIPAINIVRHPVAWLEFYVNWRSSNMRMREGSTDPLAWEWKVANHGYFEYLGLPSYEKDDIETWSSYQGMWQLNNVLGDINAVKHHFPIENIASEPELFTRIIDYLSHGKVIFDQPTLDKAYSMKDTLFRGERSIIYDTHQLLEKWPSWKMDAFRKLVSQETINVYKSFGYDIHEFIRRPVNIKLPPGRLKRSIFVSSLPKSGTWLLREILEMITGLKPYEPVIGDGTPDYENEMLIDFPPGTFFSWHSILTSRSASLIKGSQSKNIFLIRNIYDVLISMYNHLLYDVDAGIGRSVIGSEYFENKTIEQCMSLMVSGFTSPKLTWLGAGPILKQIDSMLAFIESGHAFLLDYKELTEKKKKTIKRIIRFLEVQISDEQIREVILKTDKDAMRKRLTISGNDQHVTPDDKALKRDVFFPYHQEMVDRLVMTHTPRLPERLHTLGLDSILHLEKEKNDFWSQFKQSVKKETASSSLSS